MLTKLKTLAAKLARRLAPVAAPVVRAFAFAALGVLSASGLDWAHITNTSLLEKAAVAGLAAAWPVIEASLSALLSRGHAVTLPAAVRARAARKAA